MIRTELNALLNRRNATLLGVGPMSKNCVDVTIDLANKWKAPIFLIASRRQIESQECGGGYVENWSTEEFASYVSARNHNRHIILARDHGGPWQHPSEANMSLVEAMAAAKASYEVDIRSGMSVIHIDPSIDPTKKILSTDEVVERVFELYTFCFETSKRLGKEIAIEIGTEEQSEEMHLTENFQSMLEAVFLGCKRYSLPMPLFVVGQTGAKVMQRENVGVLEKNVATGNLGQLRELIKICKNYDVLLKGHNADYLNDHALMAHAKVGIHAANVAPEFGVKESETFLLLAEKYGLTDIAEEFISLAVRSEKWVKWIMPGRQVDDREKALISGHYIFAKDEFKLLKEKLSYHLEKKGLDLDLILREAIKNSIERYFKLFNLAQS